MGKNLGLGRGLGALFGEDAVREAENGGGIHKLKLAEIEPRSDQPRRNFDDVALYELAESIRQHGVLQPLVVRKLPTGYYQIIAGERRWRAAKLAGLNEIPAVTYNTNDRHALELALIENLQREDLNPIEEAEGFRTLIDVYGLTQEDVADRVGKSRPTVANALRLLGLTGRNMELVVEERLTAGHARALLPISDPDLQEKTAKIIVNRDMTVREAELMVKQVMTVNKVKLKATPNYVDDYEQHLCKFFGRRVRIKTGAKRGKIEMDFYSADDLEALMAALIKGPNL
ncbi:MAG: ParB/RepB/Spo0J family partition protein [Oscillospiraceae bacterium]|nr:ParB/RepB/Spo0J family partition protein [Oscillospiraceae bacterium]